MSTQLKTEQNHAYIKALLVRASEAYYNGMPFITDEQYDYLESLVGSDVVGAKPSSSKAKHLVPMYSLAKYYPGEGKIPLGDYTKPKVESPKLDGAAISLQYRNGILVQALTRGDGIEGELITDKILTGSVKGIPLTLEEADILPSVLQVTGEVVTKKETPNARNYASGALNLNSIAEFTTRDLTFIAYDCSPECFTYTTALHNLKSLGFLVVTDSSWDQFPQDGKVIRVNSNADFQELGFTSKFPRGAFALKVRKEGKVTTLREVIWQTGKSGKVTPVAIFDPVELGGAMVTRATLNNRAYIEALNLNLGDQVEVQRAGEIIPQVVRKVSQE